MLRWPHQSSAPITNFDINGQVLLRCRYPPMNVSLTPELESLVNEKVRSGLYQTASEVVREALRLLKNRDDEARRADEQAVSAWAPAAAGAPRGLRKKPGGVVRPRTRR
jgi:antitoxin ParD1/3/4